MVREGICSFTSSWPCIECYTARSASQNYRVHRIQTDKVQSFLKALQLTVRFLQASLALCDFLAKYFARQLLSLPLLPLLPCYLPTHEYAAQQLIATIATVFRVGFFSVYKFTQTVCPADHDILLTHVHCKENFPTTEYSVFSVQNVRDSLDKEAVSPLTTVAVPLRDHCSSARKIPRRR